MLDPLGSAFYVVRKVVGESRGDGDEVAVFWEGYCEARHGDSGVRVSMVKFVLMSSSCRNSDCTTCASTFGLC